MITKEALLEFGFVENQDDDKIIYPFEKILGESEEGKLALVITKENNQNDFAIITPTGEKIYVNGAKSLEELKIVDESITGWEASF